MKIRITDMFDYLNPDEYKDIEIKNKSNSRISMNNIKRSALEKINKQEQTKELKNRQRKSRLQLSFRKMWIAVIMMSLISITTFGISKTQLFKEIFGENINFVEKSIQDVIAIATDKDTKFTVESLLSDGHNIIYFIISIENLNGEKLGEATPRISISSKDTISWSYNIREIKRFNNSKCKKYYYISAESINNLTGNKIKMNFKGLEDKDNKIILENNITISFKLEDDKHLKTIILENSKVDKYIILEVKVSALGIYLRAKEFEKVIESNETNEGKIVKTIIIPTPEVKLKFKNGKVKTAASSSILPDDDFSGTHGTRLDDDTFTNIIIFNHLIDINSIKSVIIEDVEFNILKKN